MQRRDGGTPLRSARAEAGLSLPQLAQATGLSLSLVGQMFSAGKSGREQFSDRAAALVADALGKSVETLFMTSTSTRKTRTARRIAVIDKHEPLIDRMRLSELLGKSPSWIDEQRRTYPKGVHPTPFPVRYAGRSPRFAYAEVLAWMDEVAQAA